MGTTKWPPPTSVSFISPFCSTNKTKSHITTNGWIFPSRVFSIVAELGLLLWWNTARVKRRRSSGGDKQIVDVHSLDKHSKIISLSTHSATLEWWMDQQTNWADEPRPQQTIRQIQDPRKSVGGWKFRAEKIASIAINWRFVNVTGDLRRTIIISPFDSIRRRDEEGGHRRWNVREMRPTRGQTLDDYLTGKVIVIESWVEVGT